MWKMDATGTSGTIDYHPATQTTERYRFPLADAATVELCFYGRRPTPNDIALLREQLEVAERALRTTEHDEE